MPCTPTRESTSLIDQISNLGIGDHLPRVEIMSRDEVSDPNAIYLKKRSMGNTMTSAISRVKQRYPGRQYSIHSHHHIEDDFHVVVVVIVTREENEF